MRAFMLAVSLLCAAGCDGGRNAANASPTPLAKLVTPTPAVPWGRFVALDYQQPGQPNLTAAEIALIRRTLDVVKPCQQQILRYSFDNGDPTGKTIDLYFDPPDPRTASARILWTNSHYYFENGRPISYDDDPWLSGIREYIAATSCDGLEAEEIAPWNTPGTFDYYENRGDKEAKALSFGPALDDLRQAERLDENPIERCNGWMQRAEIRAIEQAKAALNAGRLTKANYYDWFERQLGAFLAGDNCNPNPP